MCSTGAHLPHRDAGAGGWAFRTIRIVHFVHFRARISAISARPPPRITALAPAPVRHCHRAGQIVAGWPDEHRAILPADQSYTYADAGVSIAAGNALVRAIGPLAKATRRPGADADLGGFGGMFDLRAAGFTDPLLVAANDGVGTKLKLAIEWTGMKASAWISSRCAPTT